MPDQAQSDPSVAFNSADSPVRGRPDAAGLVLPPEPATPLIGRDRELALAADLLRDEVVRLLTITGAGGMGKTRLASRIAQNMGSEFGDGAAFVSLSAISDPDLVMETIAQSLKLQETVGLNALERICLALKSSEILLVLDNFEQVRRASPYVAQLLAACPDVKVLATSRVPLRIAGEQELAIMPLGLPNPNVDSPAELVGYPAVALFVQRAHAVKADFSLNESNCSAVATVCRRLDGVPLAIELAAARSKVLSPSALLARLSKGLDVLSGGPMDQPDRQQTLRAAIGWSHDLLTPTERLVFDQLAVFTGGFRLDAAESVVGLPTITDSPSRQSESLLDILTSLVDCNLLRAQDDYDGEPRFGMLETVREFGLEQLESLGDFDTVRRRHAEWCHFLVQQALPDFISRIGMEPWLERFESEHDNFRAALTWTFANEEFALGAGMAGRLWWFWYLRGHHSEGRVWLERVLDIQASISDEVRALALYGNAVLAHWLGDNERALECLNESLSRFTKLEIDWGITIVLGMFASIAVDTGEFERADVLFRDALTHAQLAGDQSNIALFLNNIGLANWGLGNEDLAIEYGEKALALQQSLGNAWGASLSYSFLGLVATDRGEFERASTYHRESLNLRLKMEIRKDIAQSIANIASLESARGNHSRAAQLFGGADAIQDLFGHSMMEPERSVHIRSTAASKEKLGSERFSVAWEAGRKLSVDEVVAMALGGESDFLPSEPAVIANFLTSRELDVLRLLVEGRTDREIAAALFISPRTAQGHVARLFDKLDVTTRTAAVAIALQQGLLTRR